MAFEDTVRDLGGDDEDIELLAGVHDSDSEVEGGGQFNPALLDDVDQMWAQLTKDNKRGKKTVFSDPPEPAEVSKNAKGSVDSSKTSNAGSNGHKSTDEDKEGTSTKKSTKDSAKGTAKQSAKDSTKPTKTDTNGSSLANSGAGRKTDAKNPKNPNSKDVGKAHQPQTDSKRTIKARARAQAWISSLAHPQSLLLGDLSVWWEFTSPESSGQPVADPIVLAELKNKARDLLQAENAAYHRQRLQDREYTSSLEFLKSGTFSDQLGALSILSTDSPLHSMRHIETLVAKCQIKNRESATRALEVTKDLLVSHVLPDRRLRWFKDQPLIIGCTLEQLIVAAFEDWLKEQIFTLLQAMEKLLADTVENIRIRTLHCVFDLFQRKPEQEANLLRLGLNKLGDSEGKVASRVKKLVMDVLQAHPSMKGVIAGAVAELLSRSSDYRARYYSVDTLSEFILSHRDPKLANQLVYIYLELFERLLAEWDAHGDKKREEDPKQLHAPKKGRKPQRGKKGGVRQQLKTEGQTEEEQQARLVSKIFTGLNRAFPFSDIDSGSFEKYMGTLYRMSHSPNVGTFIEALCFIFQLAQASAETAGVPDSRFYRALYDSLLDPRLAHSAKLGKYIHLLLRAMAPLKTGEAGDIARATAFAKRLIQVACQWPEVGVAASLVHVANHTPHVSKLLKSTSTPEGGDEYDVKKRDPEFAHAETSHLWELVPMLNHYHPTVALYASNLMAPEESKQVLDMPDIEQYTVNSFLAKWSYKKPKEKENNRGGSIFQPLSGYTDLTLGIRQQAPGSTVPISMQDWTNRKPEDVAPDEQFFFEYFRNRTKPTSQKASDATKKDGSDEEDEDEDEIYKAMLNTGDMGSDISDDEDLEMLDYSDSDTNENEQSPATGGDAREGPDDSGDEGLDIDSLGDEFDGGDFDGQLDSGEDDLDFQYEGSAEEDESLEDEEKEPSNKAKKGSSAQTKPTNKRKRDWASMPTFMDADAFEEHLSKRQKP